MIYFTLFHNLKSVTKNEYFLFFHVVLDYEKDFSSVYGEISTVVQWYTLGLYLKLLPYELERINLECHFNVEGLAQMLSAWLKTGVATWLSLVRALKKMGQSNLANKIAKKKGMCLCACVFPKMLVHCS